MGYQLQRPFSVEGAGGWDEIYTDQATEKKYSYIGCYYLPAGIKRMDSNICKMIRELKTPINSDPQWVKGQMLWLKEHIERNPHLHYIIKENLLLNLKRVWKEIQETNEI